MTVSTRPYRIQTQSLAKIDPASWNRLTGGAYPFLRHEFLLALVMVQKETMRTLPVGLAFFQGRYSANIPLMAAGSLIVAGPILLVYIIFQRYFIRGMLGGAVKG